jgi:hypothetical protein
MMKDLFQTKCLLLRLGVLVGSLIWATGCKQPGYSSPDGYDLEKPTVMNLGKVLNEISGLSYLNGADNLLAISDSKRKVFEINLKRKKLKDYTGNVVPPDSDIEDVVKVDSVIYMLASKGILYEVPLHAQDTLQTKSYHFWSYARNDFETLYYDPSAGGLIMMCKTCADESGKGTHNAYRFDLKTKTFDTTAFFSISDSRVQATLKNEQINFEPSGAAVHPIDKRLYILSSPDNLLVITDLSGQVIEAYHLNPNLYPQAEGIAFAPNGDMFISNEAKYGPATLLYLKFNPVENKK